MKTLHWKNLAVAISACLFLFTVPARATLLVHFGQELLTFDDLASDYPPVPNGYGALSWSGFTVLDAVTYEGNPSGYRAGLRSASNVIFGSGSASIGSFGYAFALRTVYLTAAWNDNLQVTVQGYYLGKLEYFRTYKLSAVSATQIKLPSLPVTSVVFTASGGTHHAGYIGSGPFFAMDNLTVTILSTPVINVTSAVSLDFWRVL